MLRRRGVLVCVSAVAVLSATVATAAIQDVKKYTVAVSGDYETTRLLSVGDTVPETSDPAKQFQMIGIPDGLGAHRNYDGTRTLFMNHELTNAVLSEPVIGDPLNRGAFVSKLILDRNGAVVSGERAYDTVYLDDALVGPAADATNTTPGFARFCSGSLAGWAQGFDRNIYFANEESGGAATFDGRGGLAVAIFDNEAHTLPYLGRFAWENTLVQTYTGKRTVIMGMEDGPASQDPAERTASSTCTSARRTTRPARPCSSATA